MSIWQYLFSTPPASFAYFWFLSIISILIIAAAFFIKFSYLPKQEKTLRDLIKDYPSYIISCALFLLFFLGARSLNMHILSARIFIFILLVTMAYLVVNPIYIVLKDYPKLKKSAAEKKAKKKYLPKKKRKK